MVGVVSRESAGHQGISFENQQPAQVFVPFSRRLLEGAGPLAGLLVREITEHERVQIRNPD